MNFYLTLSRGVFSTYAHPVKAIAFPAFWLRGREVE